MAVSESYTDEKRSQLLCDAHVLMEQLDPEDVWVVLRNLSCREITSGDMTRIGGMICIPDANFVKWYGGRKGAK